MNTSVSTKKVSIVILSYNQAEYISEAIASVYNQDYDNIEIICGDDASSDGTVAEIEKHKDRLGDRLIVVSHETNVGITENFNLCLRLCTGEYIFLLGGDDYFMPGKIARQVEYMESHPDVAISYHDVEVFQSSTRKVLYYYNSVHKAFSGGADLLIRNGMFCCGCSVAVRNINIPLCNPLIKYSSDWLWMIEILKNNPGTKIAMMEGVYSAYRRHSANVTNYLSNNPLLGLDEVKMTLQIVAEKYPSETKNVSSALAERYFVYGIKLFLAGKYSSSLSLLRCAFRENIFAPFLYCRRKLFMGI